MLVIASIFFGLMDEEWWNRSGTPWYYFGANREVFIVVAAGAGAALLAIVWALFIYKPRRRHSHRRHLGVNQRPERMHAPLSNGRNGHRGNGAERQGSQHSRQWRRKRREHRPRNPTLAERGGLPPMRPEGPSEPLP